MWGMATKKNRPSKAIDKTGGRARELGQTQTFTFEMTPELKEQFAACATKERRTLKAVLTVALEEYLARRGLWKASESP